MADYKSTGGSSDAGRMYHTQCTGDALKTVEAHQTGQEITLFGSCFCPFVQRVWIACEVLEIPYEVREYLTIFNVDTENPAKYVEVDPYKKPKELVELSPKGLVPALRLNNYSPPRALNESTVIMEFVEDLAAISTKKTLLPLPFDPYARALARLAADHVNRALVPAFYRYLQAQDPTAQINTGKEFHVALEGFVAILERAENEVLGGSRGGVSGGAEIVMLRKGLGLWVEGNAELGWADVMAAPWLFRAKAVLTHYRGFEVPHGTKTAAYLDRICEHPSLKATCSTEQLYLDSYERYAFNRPNTSQVATAINQGRVLP